MKVILLGALSFGLWLSSATPYAAWDEDTGHTFYSRYQGKKYASTMPSDTLNASPDFDIANATLPKSIQDIAEVAYTQLEKVTGSRSGWKLLSITLDRAYQNEKKWFYALSFNSLSLEDNITIAVTVDGRLGVIKEIQERKIE